MRSGSKGCSASVFSPTPTNTIGLPVTWRTDSAAPPRESPSALVRMMPVRSSASPKARAEFRASCPAIASTTNRRSWDATARSICWTSSINAASTCSRPAVSMIRTSKTPDRARSRAFLAISAGFCAVSEGMKSAPTCSESRCSCRIAAGRRTSVLTSSTLFFWVSISQRASLAAVVVLPAPCRPASRMTYGGWARSSKPARAPPMSATSSRLRMLTKTCPGLRLVATSAPSAFSRTASMKDLTTGSATSASSSAMRTSRRVSPMFSSVMRPLPVRFWTVRESF